MNYLKRVGWGSLLFGQLCWTDSKVVGLEYISAYYCKLSMDTNIKAANRVGHYTSRDQVRHIDFEQETTTASC